MLSIWWMYSRVGILSHQVSIRTQAFNVPSVKEHARFAAASNAPADFRSDSDRVTRQAAEGHQRTGQQAISGNFYHDALEPEHDPARFHLACSAAPGGSSSAMARYDD